LIEIQGISLEAFLQEKRSMTRLLAVLIITTVMAILFAILYLSNMLMRPINTISEYIKKVPGSGFKGNMILEGDDEFKKIAISINTMEREILQLMEREKREAEVKKKLEFKVLQNQINPHFLYNTLNSIKWMASLQHADTIRDMTAALGRLLQNISKGTDSKIPIYEEMSLLDDYILIQDIRYSGKIQVEYHIGNSEVTQAYIVKFLLQPIVENAIFHGIEPKNAGGRIDIYLERVEDDIRISIVDDGIGMTEEQIASLLNPVEAGKNERGLSGIGVSNIRERIMMIYGKEYGIEITSQVGEYTRVMIKIPYEREG
jgi:two-component system sensor histidine kinase YesM